MGETLYIKNFGGLTEAQIELRQFNALIGPQASGKSLIAKLTCFFKDFISRIRNVHPGRDVRAVKDAEQALFLKWFPPSCWAQGSFVITYSAPEELPMEYRIERSSNSSAHVKLTFSRWYRSFLNHLKTRERDLSDPVRSVRTTDAPRPAPKLHLYRPYFIPAGRSFFSVMQQNIFTLLRAGAAVDPFLLSFGSLYEVSIGATINSVGSGADSAALRRFSARSARILSGSYVHLRGRDYIDMADGRRVPLPMASSGQQESLPLLLASFQSVQLHHGMEFGASLIVEEPEAHLFPTAQREIMHHFSDMVLDEAGELRHQFLITTHSPYIITVLNNLMYAGRIIEAHPGRAARAREILGDATPLSPSLVSAYLIADGKATSIIDPESSLINAEFLDKVSNDIGRDFEQLADLMYEETPS